MTPNLRSPLAFSPALPPPARQRRPTTPHPSHLALRPMTRILRSLLAFALAFTLTACQRTTTTENLAQILNKSTAEQVSPVPVLDLRGDGSAIGAAHGRQLKTAIRLLHD